MNSSGKVNITNLSQFNLIVSIGCIRLPVRISADSKSVDIWLLCFVTLGWSSLLLILCSCTSLLDYLNLVIPLLDNLILVFKSLVSATSQQKTA